MRLAQLFAILSAMLGAALWAADARASTLSVLGASGKVCQLTGETDWFGGPQRSPEHCRQDREQLRESHEPHSDRRTAKLSSI